MNLEGKRLLVLGGQAASFDVVRMAKEMGIYTIVTDFDETGVAKEMADEAAMVSTADMEALETLAKEKKVDGVFCGPSEFNLRNVIRLCERTGLPCYTDMEVWDRCANKDSFKQYCRDYGVDCTPEYDISLDTPMEDLEKIDYPIIIKPVDGSSSAGITVCKSAEEVPTALEKAYAASISKKIIAEKFIDNDGQILAVRYMLRDGEAYPYLLLDTHTVDPVNRKIMISAFSHTPSKYAQLYMSYMDKPVRNMFKGMGLRNGSAFIQALPHEGRIYCHEMGYRLGGGLMFKLTEPLADVNDMKMMIRGAVGGESLTDAEVENLEAFDIHCGGRFGCQLPFPLNVGTIGRIEGVEEVKKHPAVVDFLQYYYVGDSVPEHVIGTLSQHFGRATFVVNSKEEMVECVHYFQDTIRVYDTEGNRMNTWQFDTDRLEK